MKPIVICRYAPHEGPGYFATYLDRHGLPWRLVRLDNGEKLPTLSEIGGLGMMGGPMSVNDDLPWVMPMLELVRECVVNEIPVIGHCLGGQLLSKALGGRVTRNAVKEIGWGEVRAVDTAAAAPWARRGSFLSYHWHGETFSIPDGASRVWSSAHCDNQAFVIGKSIGMQCHIEMTEELIESWCATGAEEIAQELGRSPAVQAPETMRVDLERRLDALHRVADEVYDGWIAGVRASRGNS
jgi:GMP synthase-like glutamine amidotransferase